MALCLQDFKNGSLLATFCASYRQGTRGTGAMKEHSRSDTRALTGIGRATAPGIEQVFNDSVDHSPEGNSDEQFK